ncbi:hypothetical protein DPMN_122348 [Dreissena polymorpha]|uniref:Uncharacterized protein n=1 Tax=Dreissena polymorpha TaxID=45954 RepID=A0A9D4GRQ7_DREPO|nr:hypothetical protein DPMN_122348 [Dreissena polymorpha]
MTAGVPGDLGAAAKSVVETAPWSACACATTTGRTARASSAAARPSSINPATLQRTARVSCLDTTLALLARPC